jgi:glycosyltransferase involved in cell wall biosynthesis
MSVLLVEKINHRYKRLTGSIRQASGLSICTQMIQESVEGVHRVEVDNLYHIEQALLYHNPNKVLLQGIWASRDELRLLREKHKRTRFYIHIHSNIPFLACEGFAFHRILEAKEMGVGIVVNDARSAYSIPGSVYLPNIYVSRMMKKKDKDPNAIHVICAGSLRPMKNHATQALGAIQFANSQGKTLHFYVNTGRSEGGDAIRQALQGIFMMYPKHQLVSLPWMEHDEFLSFLTSMDYGLQVSLSETFNIVAADYTAAGLPMVVSDEVRWAHPLVMADCGSPSQIAGKMETCREYVEHNQRNLRIESSQAAEFWRDFVSA